MHPFSELLVGDKFTIEDDNLIRLKTGTATYRLTGEAYRGDGDIPVTISEESGELVINPSTKTSKILDIIELAEQIQHEIWEISVDGDESYSEVLDRVIDGTAEPQEEDDEIIHKIALLIRKYRDEGHDQIIFE